MTTNSLARWPLSFEAGEGIMCERQVLTSCHCLVSMSSHQFALPSNFFPGGGDKISKHSSRGNRYCEVPAWGHSGCASLPVHSGPQALLKNNRHAHLQQLSMLPCDRGPGSHHSFRACAVAACFESSSSKFEGGLASLSNWTLMEALRTGGSRRPRGISCRFFKGENKWRKTKGVHAMDGAARASAASAAESASAEEGIVMLQEEGTMLYRTEAEIDRAVILNTLTCSAAAIADPVMSLVDTVFVGSLGTVALASLGPNAAIFNAIFFMMSLTGAIVVTETIGLAHAHGDLKGVQRSLIVSVVLSMVIGVVVAIAVLIWGRELLISMGTNEEMMGPALVYLRFRVVAVPASLLLIVAQAAYRAVLDLKTPCMVVLAAGLCNAILDPILMFKVNLGVAGASIATSFSQWAAVAFFAYMMMKNRDFTGPLDLKSLSSARTRLRIPWPSMSDYTQFLKDCSPLTFRAVVIIATYTLSGIVATKMGTNVAAGHQLVNQIQLFQVTVLWAFLEVGQSMVVNAMGSGGRKMARAIADRIIWWGMVASVLLAWGTWAGRTALPRIFIQDEVVLQLVSTAMLPCCAMILIGWNNALEGVLMGAGDMQFVVKVFLPSSGASIIMLIYAMYSKVTLPFGGALPYIWWALTIYYALLTLLYCFRYWVPSLRGPL